VINIVIIRLCHSTTYVYGAFCYRPSSDSSGLSQ